MKLRARKDPSYTKSEQHKICTLFSMLGGCLYRRQGLYRKMGLGQRNLCAALGAGLWVRQDVYTRKGVCTKNGGGVTGTCALLLGRGWGCSKQVGPQPTWSPKSAPTCILNRAHGLALLLQNTPRSAHSTHLERTLDANMSAHSMPSPHKVLACQDTVGSLRHLITLLTIRPLFSFRLLAV